jgi:hypothetical protein
MEILSNNFKSNSQYILLATIHNIENVVEVYLNKTENLISELIYFSDNRTKVYQFEFDKYIKESSHFRKIDEKITDLLEVN